MARYSRPNMLRAAKIARQQVLQITLTLSTSRRRFPSCLKHWPSVLRKNGRKWFRKGPLATVVRGEVEHRAGCGASPENKIGPYRTLFDNEARVPVVQVVLTVEVTKRTSRVSLDLPVMLTTLGRTGRQGFHDELGNRPPIVD